MPRASYLQGNFLGGEWSPNAQGRVDHPSYKTAMATCLNAYPVEEGAWTRRPGFMFAGTTRKGAQGRLLAWDFTDTSPYSVELTANHARVWAGRGLVFDSAVAITGISLDSPAVVSLASPQTWATGEHIQILFNSVAQMTDCVELRNRTLELTKIGTSGLVYSLTDPVTGAPVTVKTFNVEGDLLQAAHILDISTSYAAADWPTVRDVQAAEVGPLQTDVMLLLHKKYPPLSLDTSPNASAVNFVNVTAVQQDFADGPYLDHVSGSQLTPNATGPSVTLTLSYATYNSGTAYTLGDIVTSGGSDFECIVESSLGVAPPGANWKQVSPGSAVGPNGFVSTDIGRHIRLLSEPAAWQSGTAYTGGQAVVYNGAYYTCLVANTGNTPDTSLQDWLVTDSQSVFTWTWGKITAVNNSTSVTVSLFGPNLLYTTTILTWRLGVYSQTTGYPTYGTFFQGRLYLIGEGLNRVDASQSNDIYGFAPTGPDGTVSDSNGLTVVANSKGDNTMLWIDEHGPVLLAGTKSGVWMLNASQLNDPITPDSAQFTKVSRTKCLDIPPVNTPLALLYVQAFGRQIYELFQDVFSQKIVTPNLNIMAKHLTTAGIAELAYQSELVPIVWSRQNDGSLIGCTYRRNSVFSSEDPKFVGYHHHTLGSGRTVESVIVTATPDETSEMVQIVTNDPATGVRHVEMATPYFDVDTPLTSAMFVDDAATPAALVTTATGVNLYGFWHLNGKTVSAVIGGLDCNDHLVTNGMLTVPWQSDPGKLFTLAYLQSLNGNSYGGLATTLEQQTTSTPARAGNGTGTLTQVWPTRQGVGQGSNAAFDWVHNTAWIPSSDNSSYFNQVNLLTLRGIQAPANATFATPSTDVYGVGPSGADLYTFMDGLSNTGRIGRWNGNPLAFVGNISGVANPGIILPCDIGSTEYIVSTQFDFSGDGMTIANMQTFTVVQTYDNTKIPSTSSMCRGPADNTSFTVYHLSAAENSNTQFELRSVVVGGDSTINLNVIGAVQASAIDPLWSQINSIGQSVLDQTDGNIILSVYNNQSGRGIANQMYLIKINAATATVMWKIPLPANSIQLPTLGNSRVANGYLVFGVDQNLGSQQRPLYFVNTLAGTMTTEVDTAPSGSIGATAFDALSGRFFMGPVTYSAGFSGLTPLQGFATQASFTGWAQYQNGSLFAPTVSSISRDTIPGVVGFTYTSTGQLLRKLDPQEAGAANGPALAKTKRTHMYGLLLSAAITGSILIGTLAAKLRPVTLTSPNSKAYATNVLYQGVKWGTLDDDYSFDSQLMWSINRPLPLTIAAAEAFLETQDR